jgi:lipopolysaccharide export system permease protein
MSILQKYLLREWFWTLLAVTLVLVIVLLGVFLGELLNDVAGGRMPASLLGSQVLLHLPQVLGTILPLSGFIAIMWGLGRLYRDQEMAVMRASGFNWQQLLRPLVTLILPVSAMLLVVNLVVAPTAALTAESKLEKALRSASLWGLRAGQFHVLQGGDLVLYVESTGEDGRSLNNIFIQQRENDREQVWMAKQGSYWFDEESGSRYLTLEDGQITDSNPDSLDVRTLTFSRNDLQLPEPERRLQSRSLETTLSGDLLATADASSLAELQWRLSPSVALLVLGLMAIPLSHSGPREGRGGRGVLGILSYAVYANTLYLFRAWIAEGLLPLMPGIWSVHALVLVVTLVWLRRQGRMPKRRGRVRAS